MINAIAKNLPTFLAINAGQVMQGTQEPPSLAGIIALFITLFNTFAFTLAPIVIIVMIVYSGAQRMMGGDNPGKVAEANARLMWTVIGAVLLYLSVLLVNLVASTVGVATPF